VALGVFARASQRVLAKIGEDSSLAGVPIGPVNIQYNLALDALVPGLTDDAAVVRHDVATLPASARPSVGLYLQHPDGEFRLDRKLDDNGYNVRFVVLKVTT
jgi:hypothetical protein